VIFRKHAKRNVLPHQISREDCILRIFIHLKRKVSTGLYSDPRISIACLVHGTAAKTGVTSWREQCSAGQLVSGCARLIASGRS